MKKKRMNIFELLEMAFAINDAIIDLERKSGGDGIHAVPVKLNKLKRKTGEILARMKRKYDEIEFNCALEKMMAVGRIFSPKTGLILRI